MVMLQRVDDAEDNFDVRIKRGQAQVVEVRAGIEVELVVGGNQSVFAKQGLAAAVAVGDCRADLVPRAARGIVAEFRKADRNIRGGAAKTSIENVRRDAHV